MRRPGMAAGIGRLVRQFAVAARNLRTAPPGAHRVAVVWTGKDYVPPAASAAFICANIGCTIADDETRVHIDPTQLAFETGLIIGAHQGFYTRGWDIEPARFQLSRDAAPLPDAVTNAPSAWDFLARID